MRRSGLLRIVDQGVYGSTTPVLIWATTALDGVTATGVISYPLAVAAIAIAIAHGAIVDAWFLGPDRAATGASELSRLAATPMMPIAALGCAIAMAAHVVGAPNGSWAALVIALGLPVVVAQAVVRAVLILDHQLAKVLLCDLVALATLLVSAALAGLFVNEGRAQVVAVGWSVGSLLAVVGMAGGRALKPAGMARSVKLWVAGRRYATEAVAAQGLAQAVPVALGLGISAAAAGIFRTAQTLTTPLLLVVSAMRAPVIAEMRERFLGDQSIAAKIRDCYAVSIGLGTALGIAILVLSNIPSAASYIPEAQILVVGALLAFDGGIAGTTIFASAALRAMDNVKAATRVRLWTGAVLMVAIAVVSGVSSSVVAVTATMLVCDLVFLVPWGAALVRRIRQI